MMHFTVMYYTAGNNLYINKLKEIRKSFRVLSALTFNSSHRFNSTLNLINVERKNYETDHMTNVTEKILSYIGKNLYQQSSHPLYHLKNIIQSFFYKRYVNSRGNPLFSFYDNLSPVVTVHQNFDSLLVSENHVSREKKDNYYINKNFILRTHTTCHQTELIKMGLNNFLVIGDVYRRDTIDSSHFPVFHQVDGVKLFSKQEIFRNEKNLKEVKLFDTRPRTENHQSNHPDEVVKVVSDDLCHSLEALALQIFGKDVELQWVESTFPFTHPSWELEVKFGEKWVEMLGCGIINQEILNNCGTNDKVGWAFGLGLERWAMKLYQIPDIRTFWIEDKRFTNQFNFEDSNTPVKFKPFSFHPPCYCDMSFWLPDNGTYNSEDFYDISRTIGTDLIEQVELIDVFTHPKTKLTSHCYRITYRSFERALKQQEANAINENLGKFVAQELGVTLRVSNK